MPEALPRGGRRLRPARGRPPDPGKRAAILSAAQRLFFSGDPRALRMERIAREAGVSKATLYAHFRNLRALLRAVIQGHRATMTAALDRLPQSTADVRSSLVEFGEALLEFLTGTEAIALQRMLAAEPALRRQLGPLTYREGPEVMRAKVARILTAAEARGDLRPHDSLLAAEQLLGMWLGMINVGLLIGGRQRPTQRERQRVVREAVEVLLRAYANPETHGGRREAGERVIALERLGKPKRHRW